MVTDNGHKMLMNNRELYRSTTGYKLMMAHYDRELSRSPLPYETQFFNTRFVSAEIVANAGHMRTIDQPAYLSQRVLKFLS